MTNLNTFLIILILAFLFCIIIMRVKHNKNKLNNHNEKLRLEKEERLAKLFDFIKNKDEITNNEVQKFLNISDSLATEYLQTLENQNKITQIGTTGQSVSYRVK